MPEGNEIVGDRAMYSDLFCEIYNQFGWNYFPEAFANQLLDWIRQYDRTIQTALDLGCGTGVLCGILNEAGIRTSGMDLSAGMIEIARRQNPGTDFACADMITYEPGKTFDLITCTGDALNHIFDLNDVAAVFRNVCSWLNAGGVFIFDILSEKEGQEMEDIPFTYDETTTALFSIVRSGDHVIELHTKVFENEAFQFEEVIREKVHDICEIRKLLEQCGLRVLQCDDRLLDEGEHSNTWYVAAQKI